MRRGPLSERPAAGRRPPFGIAVLLAIVLAAVTGCARIPTSGPVVAGRPADSNRALQAIVPGPAVGADPTAIVNGFLQAALSTGDDYAVARSYLSAPIGTGWSPGERTVVYRGAPQVSGLESGPEQSHDLDAESARIQVEQVAVIDAAGRLDRSAVGAQQITLELARVGQEWRIVQAPDLTMIAETDLQFVFSSYPVYFLDPTLTHLVGDPRWLPNSDITASRLAALLLDGPPAWLEPAVTTAFGRGVRLAGPGAVSINAGMASVELTAQARRATVATRGLMHAQLQATMSSLPTVDRVEIRSDETRLDLPDLTLPIEPRQSSDPYVVIGSQVSAVRAGTLAPLVEQAAPNRRRITALAVSLDAPQPRRFATLSNGGSQLYLGTLDGRAGDVVLEGVNLTDPSFDWRGWLWSTNAMTDGSLTVVGTDGRTTTVEAQWLAGRRIEALKISPTGTLAAIASSDGAGQTRLQIASVTRTDAGRPTRLTRAEPDPTGFGIASVSSLAWVGPEDLAILGRRTSEPATLVISVSVGGDTGGDITAPEGATWLIGGLGPGSVLVGARGQLLTRTATQWAQVSDTEDVAVAAFPG